MPRERRGATGLGIPHRSLGIGRRRRCEDEAADDEDERREAERDACGQAEGVIDRRADVAVGGRKESVRPENAFELVGLPAPPGHARTLVSAADLYRRSWYGTAARHERLEEQQALHVERALVVEQPPPATHDELGHEDEDLGPPSAVSSRR